MTDEGTSGSRGEVIAMNPIWCDTATTLVFIDDEMGIIRLALPVRHRHQHFIFMNPIEFLVASGLDKCYKLNSQAMENDCRA